MMPLRLLLAGLVLLVASAARGQESIVVEFISDPSQLPAVVCLAVPKEPATPKPPRNLQTTPRDRVLGVPQATNGGTSIWQLRGQPGAVVDRTAPPDDRAHALLLSEGRADVVFSSDAACSPTAQLGVIDTELACQSNPKAGPNANQVAILDLQFSPVRRWVDFFNVDGSLVTLTLKNNAQAGDVAVVGIAGGHYELTAPQLVNAGRAQLRLDARCHTREVDLVGLGLLPDSTQEASLRYDYGAKAPLFAAPVAVRSPLRVMLPRSAGGRSALVVQQGENVLRSEWYSEQPPPQLPAWKAASLRVDWEVPCEFPEDSCPTLTVVGSALRAEGGKPNAARRCQYTLGEGRPPALTLPLEVAFVSRALPSWHDVVSRANQRLTAYLKPEERQFQLNVLWTKRAKRDDDRISYVEIVGPTGVKPVIKPESQKVILPHARCGDTLAYRHHGDREYEWGTAKLTCGHLDLPSPDLTSTKATLGVMGGGGILTSLQRGYTRPHAMAEVSLYWRPGRLRQVDPNNPHDKITSSDDTTGRGLRFFDYEFTLTYLFSNQPYGPLRTIDNSEDRHLGEAPYNRILLSAYALIFAADSVQVGLGLGGGVGHAVIGEDRKRVGTWRPVLAVPLLRARYFITSRFAVTGTMRGLFFDRLYFHQAPDGFRGTTLASPSKASWGLLEVGLQGWL